MPHMFLSEILRVETLPGGQVWPARAGWLALRAVHLPGHPLLLLHLPARRRRLHGIALLSRVIRTARARTKHAVKSLGLYVCLSLSLNTPACRQARRPPPHS
jgi:hypothetical protein